MPELVSLEQRPYPSGAFDYVVTVRVDPDLPVEGDNLRVYVWGGEPPSGVSQEEYENSITQEALLLATELH